MTGEEMERAIEFLLSSQARLTADVQGLKETVQGLTGVQTQTSLDVSALASAVGELTGVVVNLAESVARLETEAEANRQETREAINNLIGANEVTRSLDEDVTRLAINTSHHVTDIESKLP